MEIKLEQSDSDYLPAFTSQSEDSFSGETFLEQWMVMWSPMDRTEMHWIIIQFLKQNKYLHHSDKFAIFVATTAKSVIPIEFSLPAQRKGKLMLHSNLYCWNAVYSFTFVFRLKKRKKIWNHKLRVDKMFAYYIHGLLDSGLLEIQIQIQRLWSVSDLFNTLSLRFNLLLEAELS